MVPYIKVEDNMKLAEFIKAHVDEINENNFTKVYEDLVDDLDSELEEREIGKFTDMLIDAGINPLMYMKTIPQYYMSGSSQTSIEIPEHIQSIDFDAFDSCKGLTSITIPGSVTSIDNCAFLECTGLTSVIIGDGVKSIGSQAFESCTRLKSLTLGNSVKSIDTSAFYGCDRLRNITFNGTMAQWKAIDQNWCWPDDMEYCTIHCIDGDLKG